MAPVALPHAVAAQLGVVVLGGLVGLTIALEPVAGAAMAAGLLLLVLLWVTGRGSWWWWTFLLVLGGATILNYGFSNVGLTVFGAPLPVADLLLVVLLGGALLAGKHRIPLLPPFALAGALLLMATVRLAFDYPIWGQDALRDYTLPLELGFLPVGYWLVARYGVARCVGALRWLFLLLLGYSFLYPFQEELMAVSPIVGLQQPVPLLGHYRGGGVEVTAAFLFFIVFRPFGRASYALAALCFVPLALLQARSMYLAVPLIIAALWVVSRRAALPRIRVGIAATISAAVLMMLLVFQLSPEGRLGAATPTFYTDHALTLVGEEGPMAGSLRDRASWVEESIDVVQSAPYGWLVGGGLGPDLTNGFKTPEGILVRKPHNDYLEMGARLGLIGLGLFLGVLATTLLPMVRNLRTARGLERQFLVWVLMVAAVYILVAAAQPLLAYTYGTVPLFGLLGAGLAVAGKARRHGAPPPPGDQALASGH